MGRGLDRRAVGHGIGKRHAELDDVGAGGRKRLQDRKRACVIGVARGDEGDEARAALALQRRKSLVDPRHAHISMRRCSATAKMSLSPRPHIFMTRRLSRGKVGASFFTKAKAWDGSS